MAGRRRIWLIALALLAFVAALAWVLLGRSGSMEVQLVFVGYTNYMKTITNTTSVLTFNAFSAVVMATNSGNVAVELYPITRPERFDILARPAVGMNLPRILKPGETVLVEVVPQVLGIPWSTELMAQRRELKDRLYLKAGAKGTATVQRLIKKWLPPPPMAWPTLAPVTNAPPHKD
jgi:hypothetical protein